MFGLKSIFGGLAAVVVGVVGGWTFIARTNEASPLTAEAATVRVAAPLSSVPAPASAPAAPAGPVRVRQPGTAPDMQPQFAPETSVEPTRDGSAARKRKKLRERTAARHDTDDDDDDDND